MDTQVLSPLAPPPEPDRSRVEELIGRLFGDVFRATLAQAPTRAPTGAWFDQTRDIVDRAVRQVVAAAPEVPEQLRPATERVLREEWRLAEKLNRPPAWYEKWLAAETEEDRERIFARAGKSRSIDAWRRRRWELRHFVSLDALTEEHEKAADEGVAVPSDACPSSRDDLDYPFFKEQFRAALLELPILLVVIVYMLPATGGNASELARSMGIPQRQMARHIARIRKHLAKHGLES
ncbi:MAG: hypothetical protein KGL53_07940 [Elusimicrobia bacterium]|nr:hypothetical protein [Elusimicrobiota bacterium]